MKEGKGANGERKARRKEGKTVVKDGRKEDRMVMEEGRC